MALPSHLNVAFSTYGYSVFYNTRRSKQLSLNEQSLHVCRLKLKFLFSNYRHFDFHKVVIVIMQKLTASLSNLTNVFSNVLFSARMVKILHTISIIHTSFLKFLEPEFWRKLLLACSTCAHSSILRVPTGSLPPKFLVSLLPAKLVTFPEMAHLH